MNERITIYHNPRCSKSRRTLALLEERGLEPEIVPYLEQPPDLETLRRLLAALGLAPRQLMRTGERRYRELGLDRAEVTDDELVRAMCENPILIERPIVVTARGAALGRPPETVLSIL